MTDHHLIILIIMVLLKVLLAVFIIRILIAHRELKASEDKMREATCMAEEANEAKNQFLSNMSYNIRVPLNNVVGFSQLIATDPDIEEEQRKEYSMIIKKNSETLLNLVNDVLDISRLEAGMMKFNLQKYDAVTLCKEALYCIKGKGQPVTIDFRPEVETLEIDVDPFRFNQLLVSVLSYPNPTDKAITIVLTVALDREKNCVRFTTIGSPIASPESIALEITIRNDINKLFLTHFGGTYEVDPESPEGPAIVFTYPFR